MYCSLCKRIIDIREEQGKDYYQDLCDDCKEEYMKNAEKKDVDKVVSIC